MVEMPEGMGPQRSGLRLKTMEESEGPKLPEAPQEGGMVEVRALLKRFKVARLKREV